MTYSPTNATVIHPRELLDDPSLYDPMVCALLSDVSQWMVTDRSMGLPGTPNYVRYRAFLHFKDTVFELSVRVVFDMEIICEVTHLTDRWVTWHHYGDSPVLEGIAKGIDFLAHMVETKGRR